MFERNEELKADDWLKHSFVKDIVAPGLYENDWRMDCVIVPRYWPPHPRNTTIEYVEVHYGDKCLRYSAGPHQGFFWDIYGDNFQTVGLAVRAIMFAPSPLYVKPLETQP